MKLKNLERASVLQKRIWGIERFLTEIQSKPIESEMLHRPTFGQEIIRMIEIDQKRLIVFLQGEIQALNLELHHLGVELPGVPQIDEAQAVTKGHDQ